MLNRRVSIRLLCPVLAIFAIVMTIRAFPVIIDSVVSASVETFLGLSVAERHTDKDQIASNESPNIVPIFTANSITSLGVPFTEDFGGMEDSSAATLPAGFKIGTDWNSGTTVTTNALGTTGALVVTGSSAGGVINWANGVSSGNTERALGFLNSSGFPSPRSIILKLTNTSGSTITDLAISFDYEKYRSGSRQFDWTFFHGSTSTATTSAASGDQSYPADANNTVVSNPPLTIPKSLNLTGLSIANGTDYFLRWTLTGLGGSTNGQGLGIEKAARFRAAPSSSSNQYQDTVTG